MELLRKQSYLSGKVRRPVGGFAIPGPDIGIIRQRNSTISVAYESAGMHKTLVAGSGYQKRKPFIEFRGAFKLF